MRALQKNKKMIEFLADFDNNSDGDSEPDDRDAVDDLVAYVLDLSDTAKENDN